jgi:AcrR family transcriptional regulator
MKSASANALSPTNRFERRRERTRQDLLAAAERVLAEKGLHQTKIADIADAADVGVGTFYLHFPTKDALFDAVVEDTMRRFKAAIDEARRSTHDPIEQMRAANAAFCRFACDNREVFRIVFGHAAAYNEVIRRAQALFAADVEASYRHGVATGAFVALPPALVAQAVIGMATQVLSWWTANESVPIETLHETMFTLFLDGIRARTPKKGSAR